MTAAREFQGIESQPLTETQHTGSRPNMPLNSVCAPSADGPLQATAVPHQKLEDEGVGLTIQPLHLGRPLVRNTAQVLKCPRHGGAGGE